MDAVSPLSMVDVDFFRALNLSNSMTTCDKKCTYAGSRCCKMSVDQKMVYLLKQDSMSGVPVACQCGFMTCTSVMPWTSTTINKTGGSFEIF